VVDNLPASLKDNSADNMGDETLKSTLKTIKEQVAKDKLITVHLPDAGKWAKELNGENIKLDNITYEKIRFKNYCQKEPSYSDLKNYKSTLYADKKAASIDFYNKDSPKDVLFNLTVFDAKYDQKIESLKRYLLGEEENSNFNKYQNKIFDHEGGFVDDPVDKGGATNKGITFNTFKAYAKEDLNIEPTLENLKNLTNEQASIIYKKRYWDNINADDIKNGSIAYMLYDFNVTSFSNSAKQLQLSLIDLGKTVIVDGKISKTTVKLINDCDSEKLFNIFKQRRLDFYQNIVDNSVNEYLEENPNATDKELLKNTQKKFEKGWKNRVNQILYEK
jgi:lysozyme family protein